MTADTKPGVGQTSLWTPEQMTAPSLADLDIEPGTIISMSRLLRTVSDYMNLPLSYASVPAYDLAEPQKVSSGLYIERTDPRYKTAENLHRGVVFPGAEFADISRSPNDLARRAKNRLRNTYKVEEVIVGEQIGQTVVDKEGNALDRDEIEARAHRAAGHDIEGYVAKMEARVAAVQARQVVLVALAKELSAPARAHYRAENLDKLRITGERAIRQAIEVASLNMDWGSLTVDGIHQAAMYKIYGLPGHNNYRLRNFLPWAEMTRNWLIARGHGIRSALRDSRRELAYYEPALQATREAQALAALEQEEANERSSE